jgi:uncharacterized protein (DUF1499 family)
MRQCLCAIPRASLLLCVLAVAGCGKILPVGVVEEVDFPALVEAGTPNEYLACAPAYCSRAEVDRAAPVLAVDRATLRAIWEDVIGEMPRVAVVGTFAEGWQIAYVQRSAVFRFPDLVSVEFRDAATGSSTVSVYSRSVYGYSDLGVNKKRVDAWLARLETVVRERAGR